MSEEKMTLSVSRDPDPRGRGRSGSVGSLCLSRIVFFLLAAFPLFAFAWSFCVDSDGEFVVCLAGRHKIVPGSREDGSEDDGSEDDGSEDEKGTKGK
ncbi:uncharacterized protein SPSK_03774 [Sporothrix schenckii 1099-18]|uniref:Transmembrane protein n=1 Tax=Sporothrix schenckii 1099-18 TaxID=1397361 RepID=A0A0F2LWV5_SPOSC|nr:uncharacterized protein SPSK_03774 [Sporothrix schenckii 1099-18]KJR81932.1 hypothetical protein SPSK_03774 [Sporothrix schenckii 1099-18]